MVFISCFPELMMMLMMIRYGAGGCDGVVRPHISLLIESDGIFVLKY